MDERPSTQPRAAAPPLKALLPALRSLLPVAALLFTISLPAAPGAAAANSATATTNAVLRRSGEHTYAVGVVRLDKLARTVSFPAAINQRTGVVEYAVVTATGKTHESVFRTAAQPAHIHLAMLLLGVRPADAARFSADLNTPPPGEPVTIEVAWREDNRLVHRPLESFVARGPGGPSLSAGPWAYNGSFLARRQFTAQREGSIVSVHLDPEALVNNPRPGRENDELHHVNTVALPPEEMALEIIMRLPDRPTDKPDEK